MTINSHTEFIKLSYRISLDCHAEPWIVIPNCLIVILGLEIVIPSLGDCHTETIDCHTRVI